MKTPEENSFRGFTISLGETLRSRPRGANELAQRRNVRAIGPHATRIDRQSQHLGLLNAKPRIVQLRQTVTLGGRQTPSRPIQRTRRPVIVPALSNNVKKIVPVSTIPHKTSRTPRVQRYGCNSNDFVASHFLPARVFAPGTGALPIVTPPVVESLARTAFVSSELSLFRHAPAIGTFP